MREECFQDFCKVQMLSKSGNRRSLSVDFGANFWFLYGPKLEHDWRWHECPNLPHDLLRLLASFLEKKNFGHFFCSKIFSFGFCASDWRHFSLVFQARKIFRRLKWRNVTQSDANWRNVTQSDAMEFSNGSFVDESFDEMNATTGMRIAIAVIIDYRIHQ